MTLRMHTFTVEQIQLKKMPQDRQGRHLGGGLGGLRTPQGFMISVFFSVNCTFD